MAFSLAACGGSGNGAQSGTPEPVAEPTSTAAAVESKGADSAAADSTGAGSGAAETATAESSAAGTDALTGEETEIQVFIAASLNTVMQEVAAAFNEQYPNVKVTYNADSSGTLLTQIEEGYACDVFFSAAQKQMNKLEQEDGLVVEGTRANVVNNQVVVVTRKDSGTAVTGLADIAKASSIALADGSVPVGRYTRVAMINAGLLEGYEVDAASDITTQQVSDALGGVEISEQGNVSKVLAAVVEASCEVGTTYYSDTYGYEDQLDILETVGYDLTGDVIYPIAQVVNDEADEAEKAAAAEFVKFVTSDEAKAIFEAYYFDTNVE
jgi:molybdate transport system substrate-binding protein